MHKRGVCVYQYSERLISRVVVHGQLRSTPLLLAAGGPNPHCAKLLRVYLQRIREGCKKSGGGYIHLVNKP